LASISDKFMELKAQLAKKGISFKYDDDNQRRPGWKFAEYELKGVPVRLAMGPRDLENNQVELFRRDTKEKTSVSLDNLAETIEKLLEDIQKNLYQRALERRNAHIQKVDTYAEFKEKLEKESGFFLCHWDGTAETEEKIQAETGATIRCIPLDAPEEDGVCMVTGKPSKRRVVFAKAY